MFLSHPTGVYISTQNCNKWGFYLLFHHSYNQKSWFERSNTSKINSLYMFCSERLIWEDLCVANVFQIWVYYVSGRIGPQVSLSFLKHVATERGMLQLLQRNPQSNLSFLQEKNELLGLGYQSNVDCCCLMSHAWQKAKNKRG